MVKVALVLPVKNKILQKVSVCDFSHTLLILFTNNFLFAAHPSISGKQLYEELRAKVILVRHFEKDRLADYNRITVGSKEQMDALLQAIDQILEAVK